MISPTLTKFASAILMLGFIYFIFIRAFDTKNYKRKSLYIFISGLVLVLFFVGGLLYDILYLHAKFENFQLGYFSYLIVAVVLWLFFSIFYLVKGIRNKQSFRSFYRKPTVKVRNVTPTIKDKKEFVYIILKHENDFLLQKTTENDIDYYKGIVMKFPNNEYFHDELVKQFITKNELDVISYSLVGKLTKALKEDNVYFCYKIFLNSKPTKLSNLETINSYDLVSCNLHEMDKKIIFTSVVENDFDLRIK